MRQPAPKLLTTGSPGTLNAIYTPLIAFCLLGLCSTMTSAADKPAAKGADEEYNISLAHRLEPVRQNIEGWTVFVEPALLTGPRADEGAEVLKMLANHFQRIRILVPKRPLEELQKFELWIEWDHPTLGAMQYHPSREWLVNHGHDPRLARKIHITHAGNLVSREQMLKHPAMILHELAHAYHDQVLGFDHPEIVAAYNHAKEAGTYEQVLLYTGKTVRHYGLSNHKEYFAEGTEAYFYRNDFYPFIRAELKLHDPALHDVLKVIWEADDVETSR